MNPQERLTMIRDLSVNDVILILNVFADRIMVFDPSADDGKVVGVVHDVDDVTANGTAIQINLKKDGET